LLFTIDEETGLTGAKNLDTSLLRGRVLLNLDTEDDGIIYVGCAGGTDTHFKWTAPKTPVPAGWAGVRVAVGGLRGGHSGVDIDRNRLNAIRALTRLLQEAAKAAPLRLAEVSGGNKRNAIPRECGATLCHPAGARQEVRQAIERIREQLAVQYRGLEDGLKVTMEDHDLGKAGVFAPEQTNKLLDFLRVLPTGVVGMSQDIRGLVETSSNLAVIGTSGETVDVVCSSRSSVAGAMRDILDTLHALARLAGAEIDEQEGYPGWKPDMTSRVLALTCQVYKRLFKAEPQVTAVHAGLECGLIGERVPGIDMVSFGPQITGAHAPGERVHIPSVGRFWTLLGAVLDELSK
jgi:dipeptidase D